MAITAAAATGTQLLARSGANITISNEAPFSLVVGDAIIRDNSRVTTRNGQLIELTPGKVYFNLDALTTAAAVVPATITISQIPPSGQTIPGVTIPDLPKDIYLVGDVVNENGAISVINPGGSINVTGDLRGATVDVVAGLNFNLNTDAWLHTNRDPRQYIDFQTLRALVFNSDGTTRSLTDLTDAAQKATRDAALAALNNSINTDNSRILALGRIAITARYLNINGLVQSGVQTLTLHTALELPRGQTESFVDKNGNPIAGIDFGTGAGQGVPMSGHFDAQQQALVVDDVVSQGGRIILAGQIMSTGNGCPSAANGLTNVDIDNESGYKLILNKDTTKDRIGQITIIDTSRNLKTEYMYSSTGVTEQNYNGALSTTPGTTSGSDAVVSSLVYTLDPTKTVVHPLGSNFYYQPQVGLRYTWVEGQDKTRVTVTEYEKNSFNLFGDNAFADLLASDNSYAWRTINFTDKTPLLQSEAVGVETGDGYHLTYQQEANSGTKITPGVTVISTPDGNRYRYKVIDGKTADIDLVLPYQTYTDTSLWDNVTSSTTAGAGESGDQQLPELQGRDRDLDDRRRLAAQEDATLADHDHRGSDGLLHELDRCGRTDQDQLHAEHGCSVRQYHKQARAGSPWRRQGGGQRGGHDQRLERRPDRRQRRGAAYSKRGPPSTSPARRR